MMYSVYQGSGSLFVKKGLGPLRRVARSVFCKDFLRTLCIPLRICTRIQRYTRAASTLCGYSGLRSC